jgi:hypothetical protein
LYELVWSEPVRTIAARFGVSDVALKKACQRASVPTPERGYWAKLEAGKPVTKVALAPRMPGQSNDVAFNEGRHWYPSWTREELAGPVPPPPVFPEAIEPIRSRIETGLGSVKCPIRTTAWHTAIQKLLLQDEARRKKAETSPYGFSWDEPLFTTSIEQRRLRILNALFLTMGKFNGKVTVRGRDARDLSVSFDRQHVFVALEVEKSGNNPSTMKPGERLRFSILKGFGSPEARATWVDDADATLEQQLTIIACQVVLTAELQLREAALYQHQWRTEQKARIEKEEEQRRLERVRLEAERQRQEEQSAWTHFSKRLKRFGSPTRSARMSRTWARVWTEPTKSASPNTKLGLRGRLHKRIGSIPP